MLITVGRLNSVLVGIPIAIAVAGAAALALAREGADPAINRPYLEQPSYGHWLLRMETEGREVFDKRIAVVDATRVRPGMTVADVGAGTGLFTRLFAERVRPGGKVIAVDIAPHLLESNLRVARAQGFEHVEGLLGSQTDTGLPAAAVDLVFVSDAYHHFEHPAAMLASIRQALAPGGRLIVVDFRRLPGVNAPWVMAHVRADETTVRAEIEAAGFRLVEDLDFMRENFFLAFEPAAAR